MKLFKHPDFEQAIIRAAKHFYASLKVMADRRQQEPHDSAGIRTQLS